MKAYTTTKSNHCSQSTAVACTCAHIGLIMDTAIWAVSILLALIIPVLRT